MNPGSISDPSVKAASFFDSLKTVAAGFVGVRRRADHDAQRAPMRAHHIIIAGVLGAALFVATLIIVVRIVVR